MKQVSTGLSVSVEREAAITVVLAALYRQARAELKIDDIDFNKAIDNFVAKEYPESNRDHLHAFRSNLKKELSSTDMTWRVFIKGMKVLGVRVLDIDLKMSVDDDSKEDQKD